MADSKLPPGSDTAKDTPHQPRDAVNSPAQPSPDAIRRQQEQQQQ